VTEYGDRRRARRLFLAAVLGLSVAFGTSCGGSAVMDTRGGLVGRLTPRCKHALTRIDAASLKLVAQAGVQPPAARRAAMNLEEATEASCLDGISDWPVAVAGLQKRLALAAVTAGKTMPSVACDAPVVWAGEVEQDPGYEVDGFVEEATTVIRLSPTTCLDLARLVGRPRGLSCAISSRLLLPCPPSLTAEAVAVITLAHEQQHVDGESNEALAECYAFQHAQAVGRRLGVARLAAARIADLAANAVTLPFAYDSTECRRGGSFDLHLPGPWPLSV
jgi:hypothetical protein